MKPHYQKKCPWCKAKITHSEFRRFRYCPKCNKLIMNARKRWKW